MRTRELSGNRDARACVGRSSPRAGSPYRRPTVSHLQDASTSGGASGRSITLLVRDRGQGGTRDSVALEALTGAEQVSDRPCQAARWPSGGATGPGSVRPGRYLFPHVVSMQLGVRLFSLQNGSCEFALPGGKQMFRGRRTALKSV